MTPGIVTALTHGHTIVLAMRQVREVWVMQGGFGVALWMPLVSKTEALGLKAGRMPGWAEAIALLVCAGVNLDIEPEVIDCDQDGKPGVSYLWPAPSAEQIPGTVDYLREFLFDPIGGYSIRATRLDNRNDDETHVWHVGFHTENAARQVAQEVMA